jgi:hypothetical protein
MPNSKNTATSDDRIPLEPEASPDDQELFERVVSKSKSRDKSLASDTAIDMKIARDGTWFYHGSAIGRKALVKLFSSVLMREVDGRYYLVTPAERVRIAVDDAPFIAVEMIVTGKGKAQTVSFRTNVDEFVTLDAAHPLRVEFDAETLEPAPYIRVRDDLEALISRPVYYDLVELSVNYILDGRAPDGGGLILGVWSDGDFHELGRLDEGGGV